MQWDPDLNEMAERATNRQVRDRYPDALVTRGILVVEFLSSATEYRGVIATVLGKQGPLQPYEVLGLLAPIEIAAREAIAGQLYKDE